MLHVSPFLYRRSSGAPELLGRLEREFWSLAGSRSRGVVGDERVMRCEEFEEAGRVVVRVELPGLDPDEDVEITIEGGVLRIRACRREEHRGTRSQSRSEFFYGEMVRTLALPARADEDAVSASYVDGILEVVVPVRPAPAAARTVPVTHGCP